MRQSNLTPGGWDLSVLLHPASIAVVGASRTPEKVGHEIFKNLLEGGFRGALVPVNPKADSILGHSCYPTLSAWSQPVDLVIIAVPPAQAAAAVEDAIHAGAGAVVLITAGFRETGEAGARLEKEISARCRAAGVRLLGPNCLGLINTAHHMNASFAPRMPETGPISCISQSGALCTAILDWAVERHLGLRYLISLGNKADLSEVDFLSALGNDRETRVIMAYLESVISGDAFLRVAETVAAKKPVVIFKAGITQAGMRAASSHTGSLAGEDTGFAAAFQQSGVVRAPTYEALLDFSLAFSMQPLPAGDRVAIITNAGGPGIMAADAVEASNLRVGRLEGGISTALKAKLPPAASIGNPIDVLGDADPERYVLAFKAAEEDSSVDAIILILTPQAMTRPAETARAIKEANLGVKPLLVSFMGGRDVMPGRQELGKSGIPDYPSPERAVLALSAMWEYARWRKRPPRVVTRFPVNRRRVGRILSRHLKTDRLQVSEEYAKRILKAYDFRIPQGMTAQTGEEAVMAAERIGFPVVMKIWSPHISHKSDVGGVRLGLNSPADVRDAFDLMVLRVGERAPDARLDGVYIEAECAPGREVILGMQRDPHFGPLLMFGLGGIFVEVMKDVAFHLAPVTQAEALDMLSRTRSFKLLQGTRGETGIDLEGIAEGLQRISQLAMDFPVIQEMDINPFIVGAVGTVPVAADARMTLLAGGTVS